MHKIVFYLDFVSPFAYLAFEQLPKTLAGVEHKIVYRPMVLGALFKHNEAKSPADLPSKYLWTQRHVLWLGHAHGIEIARPATHPFNSLAHSRLALATSNNGDVSRECTAEIFAHVWRGGGEAADPARLAALEERLPHVRDSNSAEVKAQLKANTDEALGLGVFGAPTFMVGERLFWGFDSLPMLRECLLGDPWFAGPTWREAENWKSALIK